MAPDVHALVWIVQAACGGTEVINAFCSASISARCSSYKLSREGAQCHHGVWWKLPAFEPAGLNCSLTASPGTPFGFGEAYTGTTSTTRPRRPWHMAQRAVRKTPFQSTVLC